MKPKKMFIVIHKQTGNLNCSPEIAISPSAGITQVNRMSRSRRVLSIGGKQRFFGLDMVCIETFFISFRVVLRDKNNYRSIVY